MKDLRMYDTETGRFTTPDLLWSAFPSQSPYNYAYNSPLIFSDPSGLAPEKEKDREELMGGERAEAGGDAVAYQNSLSKNVEDGANCADVPVNNEAKPETGDRTAEKSSAPDPLGEGHGGSGAGGTHYSYDQAWHQENIYNLGQQLAYSPTDGLGPGVTNNGGSSSRGKVKLSTNPNDKSFQTDPKGSKANSSHTFGDRNIYKIVYYNENQIQNEITINMSLKLLGQNNLDYLMRESPENHQLDSKQRLDENTVYVIDNIGYNYAEAGNYFWGATVAKMGDIGWILMNGGAQYYSFRNTSWFDQIWEVEAYNRAYLKYARPFSIPLPHTIR